MMRMIGYLNMTNRIRFLTYQKINQMMWMKIMIEIKRLIRFDLFEFQKMQQEELPPHPLGIYEVATKETADAVAYAFLKETGDPVQYPFKFQPLEKDEVRI